MSIAVGDRVYCNDDGGTWTGLILRSHLYTVERIVSAWNGEPALELEEIQQRRDGVRLHFLCRRFVKSVGTPRTSEAFFEEEIS